MPRAKGGPKTRQRRNKILKQAKGFRGSKSRLIRQATEAVNRSMRYATKHRRGRKRDFRKLWIIRLGAAARERNLVFRTDGEAHQGERWTESQDTLGARDP